MSLETNIHKRLQCKKIFNLIDRIIEIGAWFWWRGQRFGLAERTKLGVGVNFSSTQSGKQKKCDDIHLLCEYYD